jgi:hypothetical protein
MNELKDQYQALKALAKQLLLIGNIQQYMHVLQEVQRVESILVKR